MPAFGSAPIVLKCQWCGQERTLLEGAATGKDIALYLTHLIESHWEVLELAREAVPDSKSRAGHTAWTRL